MYTIFYQGRIKKNPNCIATPDFKWHAIDLKNIASSQVILLLKKHNFN